MEQPNKSYVSSANLTSEVPEFIGLRSAAVTANDAGPMLDPCIILAGILIAVDSSPLNIARWVYPPKKSTIQL